MYAPKRLAQFVASTIEVSYYTVPDDTFTIVKSVILANSSPADVSVNLSVVPSGQIAGFENRIVPGVSVPGNSTISLDLSTVMAEGDSISASADTESSIAVTISGVEELGNGLALGGEAAPSSMGIQPVLSTTRPTAPALGQTILETDTNRILIWDGDTWVRDNPTATLAYAQQNAALVAFSTKTDVPGCSVTVNVPAGRRIKVTGRSNVAAPTIANAEWALWIMEDGVNRQVTARKNPNIGDFMDLETSIVLTPTAGMHTYKIALERTAGTGTADSSGNQADRPGFIVVEDITGDPAPYDPSSVPVGVLGQSIWTTNQSITQTVTALPLSVNVAVPAGRTLRISGRTYVSNGTSNARSALYIFEDGVQKQGGFVIHPSTAVGTNTTVEAELIISPSAGSHTYELRGVASAGTSVFAGDTNHPAFLTIEDITSTPAPANTAPSSTLGYSAQSAQTTFTTTDTALPGMTTTVTVPAGRRLRVSAYTSLRSSATNDLVRVKLFEDSTEIGREQEELPLFGANFVVGHTVVVTPTAGTHTYSVMAARVGGSGTITSDTGNSAYILVEDITGTSLSLAPGNLPHAITLAYAEAAASQTGIGTVTDLTGLAATVTVPAGRRIRISGVTRATATVATDRIAFHIYEGATLLQTSSHVPSTTSPVGMMVSRVLSPSVGTHTYKLSMERITGTGTVGLWATAELPAFILIEDITGQPLPSDQLSVPVGRLAYTETSADITGVTTGVGVVGTANITVPAGRTIRVKGEVSVQSTAVDDQILLNIREDGAVIRYREVRPRLANVAESFTIEVVLSPTAGAHTYTFDFSRGFNATGTLSAAGSGARRGHLVIEDITPTPAPSNTSPSSTLAFAEVTANQASITTEVDLTGLSVNVTVAAGRRLRITGYVPVGSTVAEDTIRLRIYEDGAVVQHGQSDIQMGTGSSFTIETAAIRSPSAGTHTYKLTLARQGGTGTLTMTAAATQPAYLLVEDITGVAVEPVVVPGAIVGSSTSRPTLQLSDAGTHLFETDTNILYVWLGTRWREVSGPRYAAKLFRSTDQAIAGGFASTVINMNSLHWADDDVVFQGGQNYTCPIAGLYRVILNVETDTGIMAAIAVAGVEGGGIPVSSSRATRLNMSAFVSYNAGEVIVPSIWNDGDAAANVREGWSFTWMLVERMGPRHDSGLA